MTASHKNIYGLIGFPVKHSLSALMHNAAFRAMRMNCEYKLFELGPANLAVFFKNLSRHHIKGLNITIPYKEKVLRFLKVISPQARLIGAVNTIKVRGTLLEGHNTDAYGFIRHLASDLGFSPKARNVSIIGAGGAAKAVSAALSQRKPKRILIYDLDAAKAKALAGHLKKSFKSLHCAAVPDAGGLKTADTHLLVNATPIGMKQDDPLPIPGEFIHGGLLVYDLIYNPCQTKLLKLAEEKGARASNGLGMLLYQGAKAFEIWTGKRAPINIMRKALEKGVKNIC